MEYLAKFRRQMTAAAAVKISMARSRSFANNYGVYETKYRKFKSFFGFKSSKELAMAKITLVTNRAFTQQFHLFFFFSPLSTIIISLYNLLIYTIKY